MTCMQPRLSALASHLCGPGALNQDAAQGGSTNMATPRLSSHLHARPASSSVTAHPCANNAGSLTVCFCTHEGGPHVQSYLDGLRDTVEIGQVALSDPTGHWVQAARDTLGDRLTSVHTDPEAMIADLRPTCAIVAYEAALAPPVVRIALEAGCHVLAEKPACVSIEAMDELVALAAKQQRKLMLAFANRVRPEVQKARELVTTGALGKIYALEMHTIADQKRLTAPEYWERWEASKARAGGGHLIWLGIHFLDMANYITGSSVVEASGFTANVGGQPLDTEDAAVAALRYKSGALGTISSGYYNQGGPKHSHMKIWGSHGWLEMNFEPIANDGAQLNASGSGRVESSTANPPTRERAPLRYTIYSEEDKHGTREYFAPPDSEGGYTPFVRQCLQSCAVGGPDPPVTAEDGRLALEAVFSVYKSQATGRAVRPAALRLD